MSSMPWDVLKNDTIRAVVRDLGLADYTTYTRRHELVKLLRDVETDGLEAVTQRLQERASYTHAREESPEIEYAGPVSPVVEIHSRPGPSRVRSRPRDISNSSRANASSTSASRDRDETTPSTKTRIPPPSYAIIYQLEQEISAPSVAPVPLLRPEQRFEGVFVPPPPKVRAAPAAESASTRSIANGAGISVNSSPTGPRRLEGVVVTAGVEAIKMQWKQDSSSRRAA
ncbi:hypothetical protein C8Q70DRAFT_80771 [Cubamyces menziesii]|uniref:Uncharacterized protein n=1 Tax=Trametes cubensis TaxID=1111947 RepID=A0AAD7XGJ3_9APHY|nr:hypothetical protein C8Q70DRAFT_80771 [Cubamyces menziesii]KAJ8497077.1 hypothetical protein ONZ51_g725 [Trametes cubensis]